MAWAGEGPAASSQGGRGQALVGSSPGRLALGVVSQQPGSCLLLTTKSYMFGNLVTAGVSVLIRLVLVFPFLAWSYLWVFFKIAYRECHRKAPTLDAAKSKA